MILRLSSYIDILVTSNTAIYSRYIHHTVWKLHKKLNTTKAEKVIQNILLVYINDNFWEIHSINFLLAYTDILARRHFMKGSLFQHRWRSAESVLCSEYAMHSFLYLILYVKQAVIPFHCYCKESVFLSEILLSEEKRVEKYYFTVVYI